MTWILAVVAVLSLSFGMVLLLDRPRQTVPPAPPDPAAPAKPAAPARPSETGFRLVLESFDSEQRAQIIRVLREQVGLDLQQAILLCSRPTPQTLPTLMDEAQARRCAQVLSEAGVKVTLKQAG